MRELAVVARAAAALEAQPLGSQRRGVFYMGFFARSGGPPPGVRRVVSGSVSLVSFSWVSALSRVPCLC